MTSPIEIVAVVLALAYLLLAAKESLWCWYCALVSSLLYVVIYWEASLLSEVPLTLFYAVMAVVGWYEWRYGGKQRAGVAIVTLTWRQHLTLFALMLLLAAVHGWAMQRWTSAVVPYVDAFILWSSVITTFMVVRKVLENWLYWIVIDSIAAVVYFQQELYLTAGLFALYVVIVIFGYFKWLKLYRAQGTASIAAS
jgi:nicotinamide mononucleotide transporter